MMLYFHSAFLAITIVIIVPTKLKKYESIVVRRCIPTSPGEGDADDDVAKEQLLVVRVPVNKVNQYGLPADM